MYYGGESDANVQTSLIKLALQWLYRTYSDRPILTNFRFAVAFYRTLGEVQYGTNLARLANSVEHYRDIPVHKNLLCWTRPLLSAEFRYLTRESRSSCPQRIIRFE